MHVQPAGAFAADLREVLDSVEDVAQDVAVAQAGGGDATAAASAVSESQLNRVVAAIGKVADGYGIRFPREFALLVKQARSRAISPDLGRAPPDLARPPPELRPDLRPNRSPSSDLRPNRSPSSDLAHPFSDLRTPQA